MDLEYNSYLSRQNNQSMIYSFLLRFIILSLLLFVLPDICMIPSLNKAGKKDDDGVKIRKDLYGTLHYKTEPEKH